MSVYLPAGLGPSIHTNSPEVCRHLARTQERICLQTCARKRAALLSRALLRDAAVGAIDAHKSIVVAAALFPVLENNLEQIG